jgi:hypothetical protein
MRTMEEGEGTFGFIRSFLNLNTFNARDKNFFIKGCRTKLYKQTSYTVIKIDYKLYSHC